MEPSRQIERAPKRLYAQGAPPFDDGFQSNPIDRGTMPAVAARNRPPGCISSAPILSPPPMSDDVVVMRDLQADVPSAG